MNEPRYNYRTPILVALVAVVGLFAGFKMKNTATGVGGDPKTKIQEVIKLINKQYVDTVNDKKITDAAITAMLRELDPHSVYIPPSDVQASNEDLQGNFEGIGVEFNILNDTIVVVTPISGGPSESVGIRPGDRIIKIDGKVVAGTKIKNEDVFKSLRGKKGTIVKVSINRQGNGKLIDFTITRDKIPIYSVDASYMAAPGVGYIKINRFSSTTMQEYSEAAQKLKKDGMKSLILDLRGNPGGFLKAAWQLSSEFLNRGQLVVFTEGRNRSREELKAAGFGGFEKGKLVVLIDEGSASASEIVSGALQDWDRAVIVGRRSFGKGLVQEPFMLSDGSEIRLTVARYYTPSKRSIQRSYKSGVDDYYNDLNNRFEHGELYSRDSSMRGMDSIVYYTANKRIVYGGGGIMPDVFVPLDTLDNSPYLNQLYAKGIFNDFVQEYMDHQRDRLKKQYPDFPGFHKNFNVTDAMVDDMTRFAAKNGLKRNEKDLAHSKHALKYQVKALIARQLYGYSAFFQIINEDNETYKAGLKIITTGDFNEMKIKY